MTDKNVAFGVVLPNGRCPEARTVDSQDPAMLRLRIEELEALCAAVYVAAVEQVGLPQPLLNRLWTVAAQGRTPRAYDVEMPPRSVAPPSAVTGASAPSKSPRMPLPDIRLTDRPVSRDLSGAKAPQAELKPL